MLPRSTLDRHERPMDANRAAGAPESARNSRINPLSVLFDPPA